MACTRYFLYLAISLAGWSAALGEELLADSAVADRVPRSFHKKGGFGGFQGGYGGFQGGYPVPINIAISQSQSSANGADGGHASGYYPNNHQFNGGYPQHGHGGHNHGYGGYNQGYGGYNQGYGGYNQGYGGHNQGHGGHRQGFGSGYYGNGLGSYNNQFNGNYHGGQGGYGFKKNFGNFYDEGSESYEDEHEDGAGFGRSLAVAESKASA